MRVIKFRAWDKKQEKMVPLAEPRYHNGVGGILMYAQFPFKEVSGWDKNGEEYILMQFTGLKDKNGKEIYEGDIMNDKGIKFEVYWNQHNGNWSRKNISELLAGETMKNSEIIGNIHENPELLK